MLHFLLFIIIIRTTHFIILHVTLNKSKRHPIYLYFACLWHTHNDQQVEKWQTYLRTSLVFFISFLKKALMYKFYQET